MDSCFASAEWWGVSVIEAEKDWLGWGSACRFVCYDYEMSELRMLMLGQPRQTVANK